MYQSTSLILKVAANSDLVLFKALFFSYDVIAYPKHCCSASHNFPEDKSARSDLSVSWNLDLYNSYHYWQQNHAVNMLSYWTESSLAD